VSNAVCRWGILSTATIGHKNWQAIKLSGNGVVAAVASRSEQHAQSFIDDCQALVPFEVTPKAVGSYEALLADDQIDAVYVPLPTGLRKPWVILAAEAGKHVLCEKPCAVNATDLRDMIEACESNGVQFMDGVMYMHSRRLAAIRQQLIQPNVVGKIKRIASQFSFNAPEEFKTDNIRTDSRLEPHGCLGDLGWYTIRFALWVMDFKMPSQVSGRILSELQRGNSPEPVPMEFSGELLFANGVSASFYNSFLTQHQQWANVSGTEGMLHVFDFVLPYANVDATPQELKFLVSNSEFITDGCDFSMNNVTRTITTQEASHSNSSSQETKLFRKFADIVIQDSPDSYWPAVALKTQIVLDACFESARNGGELVDCQG
jgi:predicted dehydrogenase